MAVDDLTRVHAALEDLLADLHHLRERLAPDVLSEVGTEAQAILLAGALELTRSARRSLDVVHVGVAEAALERGASPRMLDWSDGGEER